MDILVATGMLVVALAGVTATFGMFLQDIPKKNKENRRVLFVQNATKGGTDALLLDYGVGEQPRTPPVWLFHTGQILSADLIRSVESRVSREVRPHMTSRDIRDLTQSLIG